MLYKILALLICILLTSCGGLRTFHEYARAGDTIAVPVGMQPDFSKDNITVTITPSVGYPIVISATDPAIRGIINFYPDPISNMIVSREIGEDLSPFAQTYANTLLSSAKKYKDYYQTTLFLDLPDTLPIGLTQVEVSNSFGTSHSLTVDIIETATGMPNTFKADVNGSEVNLNENIIDSLARSNHNEVTFDFTTIPHTIEIDFTHNPDRDNGGAGKAFVVNPIGYLLNAHWHDDGTNLKVILIESQPGIVTHKNDFKFYVAGTVTNLALSSISSYDIDGNILTGVTATITAR